MNNQKLNNLLKDQNTNWKYIAVVAILAFIAGAVIMNCLSKTGFEIPQITFPERKDETANWKTYRNEEYGFEIRCPKNYSLEETRESGVIFRKVDQEKVSELSIKKDFVGGFICIDSVYSEEIIIGGERGYLDVLAPMHKDCSEIDPNSSWWGFLSVKHVGATWAFIWQNVNRNKMLDDVDSFKKILSTFRFID